MGEREGPEQRRSRSRPDLITVALLVVVATLVALSSGLAPTGSTATAGTPRSAAHTLALPASSLVSPVAASLPASVDPTSTIPAVTPPLLQVANTAELPAGRVTAGLTSARSLDGPDGIAYDSADGLVFVAGAASTSVAAIDPVSGSVDVLPGALPTHSDANVTGRPSYVGFDALNDQVFVSDPPLDEVRVYNTSSTNASVTEAPPIALPSGSYPEGIAVDAAIDRVFVADEMSDSLSLINASTDQLVGTINAAGTPLALLFDPITSMIYVDDSGIGEISYFPAASPPAQLSTFPVLNDPTTLGLDPVHDQIWVGSPAGICIIDGATRATAINVSFPKSSSISGLTWDSGLGEMVVDNTPQGNVTTVTYQGVPASQIGTSGLPTLGVYVSSLNEALLLDSAGNGLFKLSDATQTVVGEIDLGRWAGASAFDPMTDRVVVADNSSNRLVEFDPRGVLAAGPLPEVDVPIGGHAVAVTFDPVEGLDVAAVEPNKVVAVNATSGEVVATTSLGPIGSLSSILYADGEIFVAGGGTVFVLNPTTLALATSLSVGSAGAQAAALAFDPVDHRIFVALTVAGQIGVINSSSKAVLAPLPGGSGPTGLDYVPSNGDLFVADEGTNSVAVVNVAGRTIVTSVTVGLLPRSVTYVPSVGEVFVTNARSDSLSVLAASNFLIVATVALGAFPIFSTFVNVTGELIVSDAPDGALALVPVASAGSPPFRTTLTATPVTVDAGLPVTLHVGVSYPSWGYSFRYTILPSGCTSANRSTLVCRPTTVASAVPLAVLVTSLGGVSESANASVTVVAPPTIDSFAPSVSTITQTEPVDFAVVVSGGVPPYSFSYQDMPAGCTLTNLSTVHCVIASAGSWQPSVTAVDQEKDPALATTSLTSNPYLILSAPLAGPANLTLGARLSVVARPAQGTAPYSYSWAGLPQGCASVNASNLTCTPTQTGSFTIHLEVLDASGFHVNGSLRLAIAAPPSGGGTASPIPLLLVGLALLGVIVVVAVVAILRRRGASASGGAAPGGAGDEAGGEATELYEAGSANLPAAEVEAVAARGPVAEPAASGPRYFAPEAGEEAEVADAPSPPSSSTSGRADLTCANCGTVNPPWYTNCTKCKRPLHRT